VVGCLEVLGGYSEGDNMDKRLFFFCEKCLTKCYEHDGVIEAIDIVTFKLVCSNPECKHEWQTTHMTGEASARKQQESQMGMMKALINPKNLAKLQKEVMKEMDNDD